jgi:voltage-gated potassium channel
MGESFSQPQFVVIAGFGLPGRTLVEQLRRQAIDYQVVELNPQTVGRASAGGIKIMAGDAGDLETLRRAGVERATLVALMVPIDEVVLKAVSHIRKLNGAVPVVARCAFTSTGLEAMRRGATTTIVAEQVVARELDVVVRQFLAH